MSSKEMRKITTALRAEGIEFEVRERKNHYQIYVGGRLIFTRSRGAQSSRSHDTRSGQRLRNAIRHLKRKRKK